LIAAVITIGGLHKVDAQNPGVACLAPATCSDDTTPMNNGACMLWLGNDRSFYDCLTVCENAGGSLPTVQDQASNDEYFMAWAQPRMKPIWLGLVQDLNATTKTGWNTWVGCPTNSQRNPTYTNWASSEPNDLCNRNEACAILGTPGDDLDLEGDEEYEFENFWYDVVCSERVYTCVCEIGPTTLSSITDLDHRLKREDTGIEMGACTGTILQRLLSKVPDVVVFGCCCCCCCVGGIFMLWRIWARNRAQMNAQAQVVQVGFAPAPGQEQGYVPNPGQQPGYVPGQQPVVMGTVVGQQPVVMGTVVGASCN